MSVCSRFIRQLKAERMKGRRRRLLLVPLVFLSFQALWGFWQLQIASADELKTGYLMLFHHLPVMNTILLPMMAAVTASRLCDMEIKGDTLKLLYTMEGQAAFFDCKYLMGFWYIIVFVFGQGIMILAFGQMYRFEDSLSVPVFFSHLAVTLWVNAALLAIQQTLSLLSSSQLLPLGAGLTGCFLGLFSLFFPRTVARLFLWGYFAAFPVVSMDWEPSTRAVHYASVPFPAKEFLLFLIAVAAIYQLCKTVAIRKEV